MLVLLNFSQRASLKNALARRPLAAFRKALQQHPSSRGDNKRDSAGQISDVCCHEWSV